MPIIALMNQKGGVGKTTTTVNLGAALAEAGKRVCLIDLDPQAHLTINYGVDPSDETVTMYDVLVEDRSFLEAVHKIEHNIALVPSSIDLAAAEVQLVSVVGRETLLKEKLEAAQHDFDYILLDCPPSLGILTINALSVADEVLIPMQAHFLALQGVAKLLETVQIVNKRVNPKLKVGGIALTMFDAQTKLSSEVVAELQGFIEEAKGKPLPWANAQVFKTRIRRNIKLAESPSFGQTILKYDPISNGAMDYRLLAREVLAAHGDVVPPMPVIKAPPPVAKPAAPATPATVQGSSITAPVAAASPSPGTPEEGRVRVESKTAPTPTAPVAPQSASLNLTAPANRPFGVSPTIASSATGPVKLQAPAGLSSAKTQAAVAAAPKPAGPSPAAPTPAKPAASLTRAPANAATPPAPVARPAAGAPGSAAASLASSRPMGPAPRPSTPAAHPEKPQVSVTVNPKITPAAKPKPAPAPAPAQSAPDPAQEVA